MRGERSSVCLVINLPLFLTVFFFALLTSGNFRFSFFSVFHCVSLYCAVLHCTGLYCIVCTVLDCTVLYCTDLYWAALYCIVRSLISVCCDNVLYCIVLYCTVLECCTICTIVYCTVLYCVGIYLSVNLDCFSKSDLILHAKGPLVRVWPPLSLLWWQSGQDWAGLGRTGLES